MFSCLPAGRQVLVLQCSGETWPKEGKNASIKVYFTYYLPMRSRFLLFALVSTLLAPHSALATFTPNDPLFSTQKSSFEQMNALSAWETTTGSPNVTIAVIDLGLFETDFPDLRDSLWTNTKEIPGNGLDDDNDGYIDDIHGWNLDANTNNLTTGTSTLFSAPLPYGHMYHGTGAALVAGAAANNGIGGVGVSPNSKIMPLFVKDTDTIIEAVDYAINHRADIINLSLNCDRLPQIKQALRKAYDQGIVIVAAIGNQGETAYGNNDLYPTYPSEFDVNDNENWILGVGGLDHDKLATYSSYGKALDMAAPGYPIYLPDLKDPSQPAPLWGTSFSAPMVSGAAALIKSIRPLWQAPDIVQALLLNSDPINPVDAGKAPNVKRLNIGKAIQYALSRPPEPTVRPLVTNNPNGSVTTPQTNNNEGTPDNTETSSDPDTNTLSPYSGIIGQKNTQTITYYDASDPTIEHWSYRAKKNEIIIDAQSFTTPDGETRFGILINRQRLPFIRLVDNNGTFLQEKKLLPKKKLLTPTSLRITVDNAGKISYLIEDKAAAASTLVLFSDQGKETLRSVIPTLTRFETAGKNLFFIRQKGKIFTLETSTKINGARSVFSIPGLTSLIDIVPYQTNNETSIFILGKQDNVTKIVKFSLNIKKFTDWTLDPTIQPTKIFTDLNNSENPIFVLEAQGNGYILNQNGQMSHQTSLSLLGKNTYIR